MSSSHKTATLVPWGGGTRREEVRRMEPPITGQRVALTEGALAGWHTFGVLGMVPENLTLSPYLPAQPEVLPIFMHNLESGRP